MIHRNGGRQAPSSSMSSGPRSEFSGNCVPVLLWTLRDLPGPTQMCNTGLCVLQGTIDPPILRPL